MKRLTFLYHNFNLVFFFSQNVQMENDALKKTLDKVQSQLDTSLDAQESQRKVLDAIARQFGDHLHTMGTLHNELTTVLNT